MNKTVFLILLSSYFATAQAPVTTLKDHQLLGNVKSVLETAEQQGELLTEKERNNKNVFYGYDFQPIIGQYLFNKEGNIIEKRGFPNNDKKTIYEYDSSNELIAETIYTSTLNDNKSTPITQIKYTHKRDTIIVAKTNLEDKTIEPLVITQIYKKKVLIQEYTQQKNIDYHYDNQGAMIKKEGIRKRKGKKNIENYEIKYENGALISSFCPEQNILKTYYPNSLLKTSTTESRHQENVYTFDQYGNWITNTVTLDGKPSIKYYRIVDYFE